MIIIIPGFFRTKEFYKPLCTNLEQAGFRAKIVNLGRNTKGLKFASQEVLKVLDKDPKVNVVIAHSFGGIILKYIFLVHLKTKEQIQKIVFISVPHQGSWAALFVPFFGTTRDLIPLRRHFKKLANLSLMKPAINLLPQREIKIWPKASRFFNNQNSIVISNTNHDNIVNSRECALEIINFIRQEH